MPESWKTRRKRWLFNLYPPFWGSGVRVTYIADDWSEMRVELRLNWRSRNYVRTLFGGSMYVAADPFYMVMLIERLGRGYIVWDKAASILFHISRPLLKIRKNNWGFAKRKTSVVAPTFSVACRHYMKIGNWLLCIFVKSLSLGRIAS